MTHSQLPKLSLCGWKVPPIRGYLPCPRPHNHSGPCAHGFTRWEKFKRWIALFPEFL